ncbi:MAG: hypothetical protein HW421_585 [Ignavibacteria bacterium]|nr:hypothetical protein [Ignavibacteria bacterium]
MVKKLKIGIWDKIKIYKYRIFFLIFTVLFAIKTPDKLWEKIEPELFHTLEFPVAEDNEILIIISQANDIREKKIRLNYHHAIAHKIQLYVINNMIKNNLGSNFKVRLTTLEKEIIYYENQAVEIADRYNAAIIISSCIDDEGINNYILIKGKPWGIILKNDIKAIFGNKIRIDTDSVNQTILKDGVIQTLHLFIHAIGIVFLEKKDSIKAATFFQYALNSTFITNKIDPSPTHLILGEYYQLNSLKNDYREKAIAEYQEIINYINLKDAFIDSNYYLSRANIHIGYYYYNKNDYDSAFKYLSSATKYELNSTFYEYLGRTLINLQKWDDALVNFDTAINLGQANKDFVSNMYICKAQVYYENDNLKLYRKMLDSSLIYNPQNKLAKENIDSLNSFERRPLQ